MNQLFRFNGNDIRTVLKNEDVLFVLKDVCDVLDLAHRVVRQRLSDDVCSTYPIPDALGRTQDTTIINEDGLYDVILESRKPEARAFRKWITSEVIPSIRKTGSYSIQAQLPKSLPEALRLYAAQIEETEKERSEKLLLANRIEADKPKVQFAETCMTSDRSILIREVAKLASKQGVMIGEKRLFQKLRDWELMMQYRNEPT